ncbi:MAG: NADH-quinone oxidoreductase subunit J, partial [Deltaproteobacteria bacterium]|nr:NADH-quinone oxidoreductase subunit J [Deltaproteobacteria bacterium]
IIAVPTVVGAFMTVTSQNIVRAVLYLVVSLAGVAALFISLGAEFVGWTVVLVYIGAVIILFLIGIMITRAPLGTASDLSHGSNVRIPSALLSVVLLALIGWGMIDAFENAKIEPFEPTPTSELADVIFTRFVIPFEVLSIVLLVALIGGIVLARRDDDSEAKR